MTSLVVAEHDHGTLKGATLNTVTAALAVGIGAIVRNVAGGIGAFVGVVLVLPVIALALPEFFAAHMLHPPNECAGA